MRKSGRAGDTFMSTPPALTLICAQSRAEELATAEQLLRLLRRYDLSRWRFTSMVRVEQGVVPHSHPTLTLNTRHPDDDGLLLSTYLHEQLHWFLATDPTGLDEALGALRQRYPHPPVGYPEGARDVASSQLHYLVCYLEWRALREVMGTEEAHRVFTFWRADHYRALYATIMDEEPIIQQIVAGSLTPP
jgi:hypothetical protein